MTILTAECVTIYIACTHAVLCGPAIEILEAAPIQGIYVTDTIPITGKYDGDRVRVLSICHTFASAIRQIHYSATLGRQKK